MSPSKGRPAVQEYQPCAIPIYGICKGQILLFIKTPPNQSSAVEYVLRLVFPLNKPSEVIWDACLKSTLIHGAGIIFHVLWIVYRPIFLKYNNTLHLNLLVIWELCVRRGKWIRVYVFLAQKRPKEWRTLVKSILSLKLYFQLATIRNNISDCICPWKQPVKTYLVWDQILLIHLIVNRNRAFQSRFHILGSSRCTMYSMKQNILESQRLLVVSM